MKHSIAFIFSSFLFLSNTCLAQEQDIHLSNFLNYFTKEYLPSIGLSKINNKVRPTTFSRRYSGMVNGLGLILNRSDTSTIGLNKVEQSQLLTCLKSYVLELDFSNLITDSVLSDIDSLYYYDSLSAVPYNFFQRNYGNYIKYINEIKYNQVPDSVLKYNDYAENYLHEMFLKAYEFEKDMVEITTPYFFKNYSQCVIAFVRHLFHYKDSKVLLFRKENEKWGLQKVLYDNLLTLDDED
jgi:hypothetical protein